MGWRPPTRSKPVERVDHCVLARHSETSNRSRRSKTIFKAMLEPHFQQAIARASGLIKEEKSKQKAETRGAVSMVETVISSASKEVVIGHERPATSVPQHCILGNARGGPTLPEGFGGAVGGRPRPDCGTDLVGVSWRAAGGHIPRGWGIYAD